MRTVFNALSGALRAPRLTRLDTCLILGLAAAGTFYSMEHQLKDGTYLRGETMSIVSHFGNQTQLMHYYFRDQAFCSEVLGTGKIECKSFADMDALMDSTPTFTEQVYDTACLLAEQEKLDSFVLKYCAH